jgi:hypothetical protein
MPADVVPGTDALSALESDTDVLGTAEEDPVSEGEELGCGPSSVFVAAMGPTDALNPGEIEGSETASESTVLDKGKLVDSGRFACGRKGSVVVLFAPGESVASEFGPWVADTVGLTWESGFKIPEADTVGVVVGRIVVSSPNSAKLISIAPAVMLDDRTAVLSCSNTLAEDATLASMVCVRDASDVTVVGPLLVDSVNTGVELRVFPLLGDRVSGVRLPTVPSTNGVFRSVVTLVKFSVNPSTS